MLVFQLKSTNRKKIWKKTGIAQPTLLELWKLFGFYNIMDVKQSLTTYGIGANVWKNKSESLLNEFDVFCEKSDDRIKSIYINVKRELEKWIDAEKETKQNHVEDNSTRKRKLNDEQGPDAKRQKQDENATESTKQT